MMLPNGWKKVGLFDVVSIESTLVDPKKEPYSEMNLIAPDHIQSETGVVLAHVPAKEQHAISGKYLVKKGDVIYSKIRPYLKKACRATEECLCSADMYPFTVSDQMDASYLLHMLLSETFTKYANTCSARTGIPKINREDLALFQFCLPPLEEQKKIAATLLVWDSAIEKMEKLIKAKECGHAVLMNNMLKKAKTWDCNYLSDIATIKKGKQLNAVDMISDGAYYVMNGGITPSGNTDDWNTAENTISISEGGNSCGFVAFNKEKFWAGGHCYTLIDLSEVVSVKFLFHYLKNMEKEIMAMRVGSGLPNIQKDSISDIEVLYPSKKEQKRISEVLDDSLSEISLLKQQLENYKKQKQGLMQKLLTGQWRVK